jgi:hypothetical protein
LPAGQAIAVDHPPASAAPPPRVPTRRFYLAELLCALLLANAALVLVAYRFPKVIPIDLVITASFAQIVIALGALVMGRKRRSRRSIDVLAAITILATIWDLVNAGRGYFTWMTQIADASQESGPIHLVSFQEAVFAVGWRLAAGLTGWAAAWIERGKSGRP